MRINSASRSDVFNEYVKIISNFNEKRSITKNASGEVLEAAGKEAGGIIDEFSSFIKGLESREAKYRTKYTLAEAVKLAIDPAYIKYFDPAKVTGKAGATVDDINNIAKIYDSSRMFYVKGQGAGRKYSLTPFEGAIIAAVLPTEIRSAQKACMLALGYDINVVNSFTTALSNAGADLSPFLNNEGLAASGRAAREAATTTAQPVAQETSAAPATTTPESAQTTLALPEVSAPSAAKGKNSGNLKVIAPSIESAEGKAAEEAVKAPAKTPPRTRAIPAAKAAVLSAEQAYGIVEKYKFPDILSNKIKSTITDRLNAGSISNNKDVESLIVSEVKKYAAATIFAGRTENKDKVKIILYTLKDTSNEYYSIANIINDSFKNDAVYRKLFLPSNVSDNGYDSFVSYFKNIESGATQNLIKKDQAIKVIEGDAGLPNDAKEALAKIYQSKPDDTFFDLNDVIKDIEDYKAEAYRNVVSTSGRAGKTTAREAMKNLEVTLSSNSQDKEKALLFLNKLMTDPSYRYKIFGTNLNFEDIIKQYQINIPDNIMQEARKLEIEQIRSAAASAGINPDIAQKASEASKVVSSEKIVVPGQLTDEVSAAEATTVQTVLAGSKVTPSEANKIVSEAVRTSAEVIKKEATFAKGTVEDIAEEVLKQPVAPAQEASKADIKRSAEDVKAKSNIVVEAAEEAASNPGPSTFSRLSSAFSSFSNSLKGFYERAKSFFSRAPSSPAAKEALPELAERTAKAERMAKATEEATASASTVATEAARAGSSTVETVAGAARSAVKSSLLATLAKLAGAGLLCVGVYKLVTSFGSDDEAPKEVGGPSTEPIEPGSNVNSYDLNTPDGRVAFNNFLNTLTPDNAQNAIDDMAAKRGAVGGYRLKRPIRIGGERIEVVYPMQAAGSRSPLMPGRVEATEEYMYKLLENNGRKSSNIKGRILADANSNNPQDIADYMFSTIANKGLFKGIGTMRAGIYGRGGAIDENSNKGFSGSRKERMTMKERRSLRDVAREEFDQNEELSDQIMDSFASGYEEIMKKYSSDSEYSINNSEIMKKADKISKRYFKDAVKDLASDGFMSEYYAGFSKLYDSKVKKRKPDFKTLYGFQEETGADRIHGAHPEAIVVSDAIGRGGLVENASEASKAMQEVALSMPTGNYRARYAFIQNALKKASS
jgi:hypothetical protein